MAMIRPAPKRISSHSIAAFRAGGHIHRVLAQVEIALLILQIAPHPVQMNRMRHHGVVYQHDPHTLAIIETRSEERRVGREWWAGAVSVECSDEDLT